MKFTKYTCITACAVIGVVCFGAKLSLKTMEQQNVPQLPPQYVPSLRDLSSKEAEKVSVQELRKIFSLPSLWNETDQLLLKKFTSPAALNEFRDKGTIEGEPINTIVTNNWASYIFKPAMKGLVYPFDGNIQELKSHSDSIKSVAFSPDGKHIASGSQDNTICIWTLQTNGTWGQHQLLDDHTDGVRSVAFSPNGKHIASGSQDGIVRIWTLQADGFYGELQVLTGHTDRTGSIYSLAFSPDSKHIASGSEDHRVRVWTLQANSTWGQPQVLIGHTDRVNSVTFNPDSTYIASSSDDHTIRVWTVLDGTSQVLSGHSGSIYSVVFSPDGKHIASGSQDGTVRILTLQENGTWRQSQVLAGHTDLTGSIYSLAFSPDGKHIASGSQDGTVSILTLQENGTWRQSQALTSNAQEVYSVAFSPDGKHTASGSRDLTVRVWTQIDLVGDNNVAEKIMLLQLLNRDGKGVLSNKPLLQKILATFDDQAKKYLNKKYDLNSMSDKIKSGIDKVKSSWKNWRKKAVK